MSSPDPGPVVVIGLRQIYDSLVRLESTVARLVDQHDGATRDLADHEARLRGLERGRWPLPSLAAAVSLASMGLALFVALR